MMAEKALLFTIKLVAIGFYTLVFYVYLSHDSCSNVAIASIIVNITYASMHNLMS